MAALEAAGGSASLDVPAAAVGTAAAKSAGNGGGGISSFMQRIHSGSQAGKPDPAFEGQPTFSIGPVDIHAGQLVRQFRVRQRWDLDDRLAASAGLAYDLKADRLAPFGTLTYKLEPDNATSKSRIELNTLDRRLLVRKGWELKLASATIGVSAEARITLRDADSTTSTAAGSTGGPRIGPLLRPDLHISLDHVKPLKYELVGIAAVLLLGLPLKLSNQEVQGSLRGLGLGAPLGGFGRASLKRTGYAACKLSLGQAAAVLDL